MLLAWHMLKSSDGQQQSSPRVPVSSIWVCCTVCQATHCWLCALRLQPTKHQPHRCGHPVICSHHSCKPAGLFIPSLALGGAWGRLVGMLVQGFLREVGSEAVLSMPAYAVSPGQGREEKPYGVFSTGPVEQGYMTVNAAAPSGHPQQVLSIFTLAKSTWQPSSTGMNDASLGSARALSSNQIVDRAAGSTSSITLPCFLQAKPVSGPPQAVTAAAMLGILTSTC